MIVSDYKCQRSYFHMQRRFAKGSISLGLASADLITSWQLKHSVRWLGLYSNLYTYSLISYVANMSRHVVSTIAVASMLL